MTKRIKIGLTMSISSPVTADLLLRLVAPKQTIEPIAARFFYRREDPYAIRIAFHVGLAEPREWFFARDLLSMGIAGGAGLGDVTVWPSAGSEAGAPGIVLNIEISSPSGRARFEASVEEISDFLRHTYQVVPAGEESSHIDVEAELTDLLRQASLAQNVATLAARASWGQPSCVPGTLLGNHESVRASYFDFSN
jgi:Streptomyces sporulation and cell division protein, SsgA